MLPPSFLSYSEKTKVVTDIHSNSTRGITRDGDEASGANAHCTQWWVLCFDCWPAGGTYLHIDSFRHAKHMINGTTTTYEYTETVKCDQTVMFDFRLNKYYRPDKTSRDAHVHRRGL